MNEFIIFTQKFCYRKQPIEEVLPLSIYQRQASHTSIYTTSVDQTRSIIHFDVILRLTAGLVKLHK